MSLWDGLDYDIKRGVFAASLIVAIIMSVAMIIPFIGYFIIGCFGLTALISYILIKKEGR